eukprot:6209152-Pleurochrysis_carterae.AAC.3
MSCVVEYRSGSGFDCFVQTCAGRATARASSRLSGCSTSRRSRRRSSYSLLTCASIRGCNSAPNSTGKRSRRPLRLRISRRRAGGASRRPKCACASAGHATCSASSRSSQSLIPDTPPSRSPTLQSREARPLMLAVSSMRKIRNDDIAACLGPA